VAARPEALRAEGHPGGSRTRDRRHAVIGEHPEHDDDAIDRITADAIERLAPSFPVTPGEEGMEIDVD